MKKLFCLMFLALFLTACSSDSNDPAEQPAARQAQPAEETTTQKAVDATREAKDQVVEKAGEVKDATVALAEKTADAVSTKAAEVKEGASEMLQQGGTIYQQNCRSCHDSGVMGAPQLGDERYSGDLETLVENSINGIGRMPARGGNKSLTDDEVRAAVEYMVEESK
ncbi:MAG: c-type cytochrome [Pelovirga sp.]